MPKPMLILLKIKQHDDEIFKKPTQPLIDYDFTTELIDLGNNMVHTMRYHKFVGLAANQVGIRRKIIIVQNEVYPYVVINPEIVSHSVETDIEFEGCGSVLDLIVPVRRYKEVLIEGKTPSGLIYRQSHKGYIARIFQHEIDHLNNVFISDRTSELVQETRS